MAANAPPLSNVFTRKVGIEVPIICGAMYPCSNPELVAAVSEAGGIGIVQPVSMTYVHGHDYREGLRLIRRLTDRPIGVNALIEQSSKKYRERVERWIDIALEEGVRFFVTSLGNPRWVVDRVAPLGGIVYHDVTERRWAQKGLDGGVHGLIAVNSRAGGHAGRKTSQQLFDELAPLGLPLVCAGGIGDARAFKEALEIGYVAVQAGTRFIATEECLAHPDYKRAIVEASSADVVLTDRLTGIPVAVLNNEYVQRLGTRANPIARWLLRQPRTKHWMRMFYAVRSFRRLKKDVMASAASTEYWQAGKSVDGIHDVVPARVVVQRFADALAERGSEGARERERA